MKVCEIEIKTNIFFKLIFQQKSQNCNHRGHANIHTYIQPWKYMQEYSQETSCERRQPRVTS